MKESILSGFIAMAAFGFGLYTGITEPLLYRFMEKPLCYEQTVGHETIKNCYKVILVNNKQMKERKNK